MVFLAALVVTALFMLMLFLIFCSGHMSQVRIQHRMSKMIAEAEHERKILKRQQQKGARVVEEQSPVRSLAEMPFSERVILPFLKTIEDNLNQFAPRELKNMMEMMLFRLGGQERWTVNHLAAGWVLSVLFGGLLALLAGYIFIDLALIQKITFVILGMVTGALLPFMLLQSAIRRRQAAIKRQLPDFLDFLCVSVQAGLSFDGAVAKIVSRMKGPLIDEFRRMLRDTSLGMTKQRTLTQLAKRCDTEEMYLFTSSIIQAEHLGTSMSKTLQMQADNMRDRHRQAVKAAALQAPIKIIFPMVIFIFPSIFVMVVLPAALALLKTLGK